MKRNKGEGMIREYEQGKWLARITINGKQKAFYGSSEKEVTKKLKDFKKKISMGLTDSKRMQYSDFLDIWLEKKKLELKPQSYNRLESTVDLHIKPTIGFYYLDKIDSDIIQEEIIRNKWKNLSYSSLKKIYDAVNTSFKFAKSRGLVVHNPVELVTLPSSDKLARANSKVEILSEDEIIRFVKATNATYSNGNPIYKNGKYFS